MPHSYVREVAAGARRYSVSSLCHLQSDGTGQIKHIHHIQEVNIVDAMETGFILF
jgi:hypothetical protein